MIQEWRLPRRKLPELCTGRSTAATCSSGKARQAQLHRAVQRGLGLHRGRRDCGLEGEAEQLLIAVERAVAFFGTKLELAGPWPCPGTPSGLACFRT